MRGCSRKRYCIRCLFGSVASGIVRIDDWLQPVAVSKALSRLHNLIVAAIEERWAYGVHHAGAPEDTIVEVSGGQAGAAHRRCS
jgi:hypothetical protein